MKKFINYSTEGKKKIDLFPLLIILKTKLAKTMISDPSNNDHSSNLNSNNIVLMIKMLRIEHLTFNVFIMFIKIFIYIFKGGANYTH